MRSFQKSAQGACKITFRGNIIRLGHDSVMEVLMATLAMMGMVVMAMMRAVMMAMMGDEFDALIRSSLSNFSPLQLFIWLQSLLCYCVKLQFREEWQCRQGRHSWALFCFEGFPVR